MKILVSDSAVGDLEAIKRFYTEQAVPEVGIRLVAAVIERIQTLRDHPDIGRVVPEFADPKLRELIHPPFRVVYLRENTAIHVIRVWRSERLLVLPEKGV